MSGSENDDSQGRPNQLSGLHLQDECSESPPCIQVYENMNKVHASNLCGVCLRVFLITRACVPSLRRVLHAEWTELPTMPLLFQSRVFMRTSTCSHVLCALPTLRITASPQPLFARFSRNRWRRNLKQSLVPRIQVHSPSSERFFFVEARG